MEALRLLGPLVLAVLTALAVDQLTRARGLDPPGFREPWRRTTALVVVAFVFWVGVFLPLGQVGVAQEVDLSGISTPRLFLLHGFLVAALAAWLALAYGGFTYDAGGVARAVFRQLGLATSNPFLEVGIGAGLGLLIWPMLLVVVGSAAFVFFALGAEGALPAEPPPLIVWIASLPVVVKLGIAASAGVVEEIFFRGLLQPRVGVLLSTLLFVLAHVGYDQPFMLVGITFLSFFFAGLVVWRQNVWSAITAHFLFDAVQLLVVIPWALSQWEDGGDPSAFVAMLVGAG